MANKPSIKTLEAVFGAQAAEARKVLEMTRAQLEQHPVGAARVKECLNAPKDYDLRMTILGTFDGIHGYESVKIDRHYAEYLNVGESYTPTLIYFDGRYRVQSYGDFVEIQERRMPKRRTY